MKDHGATWPPGMRMPGSTTAAAGQYSSPTSKSSPPFNQKFFHRSSSAPDFTDLPGSGAGFQSQGSPGSTNAPGSGFQSQGPRNAGKESPRYKANNDSHQRRWSTSDPSRPTSDSQKSTSSPGAANRSTSEPPKRAHSEGACPEATSPDTLAAQLTAIRDKLSPAERKKHFTKLCLKWHPDKNVANQQHATTMFQVLQEKKGWFLAEP